MSQISEAMVEAAAAALYGAMIYEGYRVWPTLPDAGEKQTFINAARLALQAAEAEREKVEPDYWAVHTVTGSHIGLWKNQAFAREALKEFEGGTITPLYASQPPTMPSSTSLLVGG